MNTSERMPAGRRSPKIAAAAYAIGPSPGTVVMPRRTWPNSVGRSIESVDSVLVPSSIAVPLSDAT